MKFTVQYIMGKKNKANSDQTRPSWTSSARPGELQPRPIRSGPSMRTCTDSELVRVWPLLRGRGLHPAQHGSTRPH